MSDAKTLVFGSANAAVAAGSLACTKVGAQTSIPRCGEVVSAGNERDQCE